jgi:hypothetical protein
MQPPHMIRLIPHLTSNCAAVRQLRISVPEVPDLIDNVRYFRPGDLPAPSGLDLRAVLRPKITNRRQLPRRDWADLDMLISKA